MPGRVPSHQRQQAERLDRERGQLERLGQGAAERIGRQARLAVLRAWKTGGDPLTALQDQVQRLQPLLGDALVAAHLQGRRRMLIHLAPQMRGRQHLALNNSVYDRALEFLQQRLQLSEADLLAVQELYRAEIAAKLGQLTTSLHRSLLQTLHELLAQGAGVRQGVVELGRTLEAAGITPASSSTLEAIFRTETQMAYSAGRWNSLQTPEVQEILWGFQYVTVGDDRVRPAHAAMDGITLPKDHPFWRSSFPPNGWNCRCQAIELFSEQALVTPEPLEVNGRLIAPDPDPGFAFNPGELFPDRVAA